MKDIGTREIAVVGYDGHSQPIRRYRDELSLPDHRRATVSAEDIEHAEMNARCVDDFLNYP